MSVLTVPEKLEKLRQLMRNQHIDALIVMSADPHMSEYLPDYWKARQWLSGFSGSVGTLVVTQKFAGLWADGRYWVQAEQQLAGTGFQLQKLTSDQTSTHLAWIEKNLPTGSVISVNGQTLSIQQFKALEHTARLNHYKLETQQDSVGEIWLDRPELPSEKIHLMPEGLNALSRKEKIQAIRESLANKNIAGHFISSLDDIAWVLNARGQDVEYNPVFLSHLYINAEQAILFIDAEKVNVSIQQALAADGIEIRNYEDTAKFLSNISDTSVLLDPAKVSIFHEQAIAKDIQVVYDINPSTLFKSRKHESEIAHIRHAMLKDGVALCHFFHWLEKTLHHGESISELTIDEKITAFRAQQDGFIGPSFSTIAGFNANGALPHYRATEEHYSFIEGDGLLLIDSGGQYVDGTTDITRVVPVGTPTGQQKRDYTLVLKCHIALAKTIYPEGLAAPLLDSICRHTLWQHGLDYRHGTGHGVGFALNVHEGPQVLSYYAPVHAYSKLREGMILSNEPGLYHEGQYGIRIENLVANKLHSGFVKTYGDFLEFETLTLCPIHLDCIVVDLLTNEEKDWLNSYHQTVQERLAEHLSGDVLDWLIYNTRKI
ncbi:Xaa-Pro aminopeptidase [Acinetobacter pittii]|uniref:aminopeptidase P family protein n=1 Tax=Acinetobacter calcoaceticus/baumannii complex TaxID=909768 RepID=UPI000445C868|nr:MULTISPECIES: aminopeptidase P family protein [Acinetobacter calcoaceticus/baumannii complex]EXE92108.1 metallopeptidase M24 family protein [Acinetobacter sp. 1578804]EXR43856.1 metallopeptidase M24 family protein [Acinetobacter sp. 1294243]KCX17940.1 metallopeptidase M24 family protein [Acinetobacter sp. 1264765]KQE17402.1 peptidase M24 [Acinetobacter pittii]KQE25100.1 peptidase M24 [Acinetobacter pittii]